MRISTYQEPVAIVRDGPHWTVLVGHDAGEGDSFESAYLASLRRRRSAPSALFSGSSVAA
jgi:hypothetical protein